MLNWDKNVIEYLDRAEEYSDFSRNVISVIRPYINKCKNALEIGCGIGNVSIGLSKIFDFVTCIDISDEIIKNLRLKIKNKNIKNIEAIVLNSNEVLKEKYDLIFTSFFFEQDDFIRMIKQNLSSDGVAIFVFRKNMKHIIRRNVIDEKESYYKLFESKLKKEKFVYKRIEHTFYKNQPFIDDDDIKKFCRLYGTDFEEYKKNVAIISAKNYKYLYEVRRDTYIYVIETIASH